MRWIAVACLVAGLVALGLAIAAEGPDRSTTGRVTTRLPHRLCVRTPDGETVCAQVDAPQSIGSIERGDCVRLTISADDILVEVTQSATC